MDISTPKVLATVMTEKNTSNKVRAFFAVKD